MLKEILIVLTFHRMTTKKKKKNLLHEKFSLVVDAQRKSYFVI